MVLSRELANRIGVRRPQRGGFGRPSVPVKDAREVLDAKGLRRMEQSSLFNPRPSSNYRQRTSAFRNTPRMPIVQRPRVQNRFGPSLGPRRGGSTVRREQRPFYDRRQNLEEEVSDEECPIPHNPNKRIRVNRTGISVTTLNNVTKVRDWNGTSWHLQFQSATRGRTAQHLQVRRHQTVVEDEEGMSEDDLERLTVEDVVGRPTAPPSGRLLRASAGGTSGAMPSGRIRQRLDVDPRPSASRPAVLTEPVEGASVLVSNLHPQVTESDMRDLFQDIGPMQDARLVSTGTALVTFFRRATAIRACDTYHGRLLDGQPMNLTLLTVGTSQSRSRGHGQPGPSASSSYFASKYL